MIPDLLSPSSCPPFRRQYKMVERAVPCGKIPAAICHLNMPALGHDLLSYTCHEDVSRGFVRCSFGTSGRLWFCLEQRDRILLHPSLARLPLADGLRCCSSGAPWLPRTRPTTMHNVCASTRRSNRTGGPGGPVAEGAAKERGTRHVCMYV